MASQTVMRVPPLAHPALFPGTALIKKRNIKIVKNLKLLKRKTHIFSNRQRISHNYIIHPRRQLVVPVSPVLLKDRK